MLKIAVCDDEKQIAVHLSFVIKSQFIKHNVEFEITEYFDAVSIVNKLKSGVKYDILFLDIEMPSLNGIELAEIASETEEPVIVFVSNREHYVFEAIVKIHPFAFIRKSFFETEIPDVVYKIIEQHKIRLRQNQRKINLELNDKIISVNINELKYIEAYNKFVDFYYNGKKCERHKVKFAHIFNQLQPHKFIHIHRCTAVNSSFISLIERYQLFLENTDRTFPISKVRFDDVNEEFCKYTA